MKVYLSGASKELERCERWRDKLIKEGIEITVDWMKSVRDNQIGAPADLGLDKTFREQFATQDIYGVKHCHVFWLLVPNKENHSLGAWVELGAALMRRITYSEPKITIITSGIWRSIFMDVADVNFVTDDDAFKFIMTTKELFGGSV